MPTNDRAGDLVRAAKLRAAIVAAINTGELTAGEISSAPAVAEFSRSIASTCNTLARMVDSKLLANGAKRPDGRKTYRVKAGATLEPKPRAGTRWRAHELEQLAAEGRRLLDAGEVATHEAALVAAQHVLPKDRQRADPIGSIGAFRRYLAKAPKVPARKHNGNGIDAAVAAVDAAVASVRAESHLNGHAIHAAPGTALAAALLPLVVERIAHLLIEELRAAAPKR